MVCTPPTTCISTGRSGPVTSSRRSAPWWAVEARPPGAYVLMRLDSTDAAGEPVATTWQGSLYLGTAVDGAERSTRGPSCSAAGDGGPGATRTGPRRRCRLDAGAAHVYTECARIWNPIHTDPVAAQRAGLPAIILHGTATHALAVSEVVARYAGGDPTRVRRIGGRFGGMVLLPSTVTVATRRRGPTLVEVAVRSETGGQAVRDGFVELSLSTAGRADVPVRSRAGGVVSRADLPTRRGPHGQLRHPHQGRHDRRRDEGAAGSGVTCGSRTARSPRSAAGPLARRTARSTPTG